MDKELLRIAIIATGLIIILGMLFWGYFKNQRTTRHNRNFFLDLENTIKSKWAAHFEEPDDDGDYADESEALDVEDNEHAYAHKSHAGKTEHKRSQAHQATPDYPEESVDESASKQHLPRLIQLSIVAKTEHGFNGADLDNIFNMIGLEYGSVKIYERLDMKRMVEFSVASMINPGTFPDTHLEAFYTPGLAFFMQPRELPDAVLVFDDLIRTINLLAIELDGIKWDAERNPLTDEAIKTIRKSLQ
jgi:cell division protein ZipA